MDKKNSDDLVYSKVLIQKVVEHKDMFGVPDSKTDLQLMPLSEYRELVKREAFFLWITMVSCAINFLVMLWLPAKNNWISLSAN